MIEENSENDYYLMDQSCSSEDSGYQSQASTEEHFMSDSTDKSPDPAELIREYCKICFRGQITKHYSSYSMNRPTVLKAIAHSIYENSNYRIINSRILYPEKHYFPLYSVDSLKLLIEEMQPMFQNADNAKRIDAEACEAFTRCKSSKLRPKGVPSRYEYIDIDTNRAVDYADFERRYHLFLISLRNGERTENNKTQRISSLQLSSSPIVIDSAADDDKENTKANQMNISEPIAAQLSLEGKNFAQMKMTLHSNKHSLQQDTLNAMKSPRLINTTSQQHHTTTIFQIDL